jgi:hypothetical protein
MMVASTYINLSIQAQIVGQEFSNRGTFSNKYAHKCIYVVYKY